MPDIPVGAQIFDLVFHPTHSTVYTGLLTGQIKAYAYDSSTHEHTFTVRPSKKSCRSLTINEDGSRLYAVGKAKAIYTVDTVTTDVVETRAGAHEDPINRIKHIMPWLFATGDDAGVIKLWDPRQQDPIRTHKQHFDYITDFLWLQDKHHLLATSGDGTLSVMDVRSKKMEPFAQSEYQEDELLSATTIKGGAKIVVGTQIGILSVFNRSSGYGDCVDRVPGHPASIDALCALPQSLPNVDASSTILTGSSDGFVRAVQVLPTKLFGVVADHGEFPIERIAIGEGIGRLSLNDDDKQVPEKKGDDADGSDTGGQGRWWVGSAGHDEILRLTNLEEFFENVGKDKDTNAEGEGSSENGGDAERDNEDEEDADENHEAKTADNEQEEESGSEGEDSDAPKARKRKRKPEKDPLAVRRKKGKNEVDIEGAFFDEL